MNVQQPCPNGCAETFLSDNWRCNCDRRWSWWFWCLRNFLQFLLAVFHITTTDRYDNKQKQQTHKNSTHVIILLLHFIQNYIILRLRNFIRAISIRISKNILFSSRFYNVDINLKYNFLILQAIKKVIILVY